MSNSGDFQMNAQSQAVKKDGKPMTGADAIVAALQQNGVEVIFGITGGTIMPVYDSLYEHESPRHIIVGHEQGAAHMADGYARATGKPGVVMTTSGPGATNLITGLANAMMDSIPMVALTGQVPSTLIGNDAFQEADMWGITLPVTKHNYQVSSVEELPSVFAEAFYLCQTGRPGPVLIDIPKDVMLTECSRAVAVPEIPEGYEVHYAPDPGDIEKAMQMVAEASRPMILAGGGVISADASSDLTAFADKMGIPVATTLMGLGAFPSSHELCLGMPGMHGHGFTNLALHECDLLMVVGCRLDDRVTGKVEKFVPDAELIHIDVDASEINKILPSAVSILADAKPAMKALNQGADAMSTKPDFSQWHKQIAKFKEQHPRAYQDRPGQIVPQAVIEAINQQMKSDDIMATGVGQHQMYAAQYHPVEHPRTFISSGGLGTMGFGLPAALGAKLGAPDKQVVCVDGDGCFLMNIQEMTTAVRYGIGVVVVILNNGYLGMVRQWQDLFNDGRRAETKLAPPPFDKVAQAFGGLGRRVEKQSEVGPALEWALTQSRMRNLPVILDVQTDPDALVFPMVPAGGSNAEFIASERKD
jgi:acetolactate synthase-1/2/3 large subunit